MAHYKRKKRRTKPAHNSRSSICGPGFRKKKGLKPVIIPDWQDRDPKIDYWPEPWGYVWMANWPRYWDILHHTRPTRRREKVLINRVLGGKIDPEDAAWPLHKKPHKYYW